MAEAQHPPLTRDDLVKAMADEEVEILFQPQVETQTGLIVGAEALARWHHPKAGELGAETLFQLATRTDCLAELSEHVQRRAVAAAASWPSVLRHLRLSVNIIAADTVRPDFEESFLSMVRGSGFDPTRLTLEVTETELIENLEAAAGLLERLREKGVSIALDDFGTGYSSLLYLKALPLDALKIDKRLTEDISGSGRDRIVVRSVIGMARALGLQVIAEGVETEEQRALLVREGCDLYQGYLCSPPVESEELAGLV